MKHNDIEFHILPQTPNKKSSDTRRNKVKQHKRKVKSTVAVISQLPTGTMFALPRHFCLFSDWNNVCTTSALLRKHTASQSVKENLNKVKTLEKKTKKTRS